MPHKKRPQPHSFKALHNATEHERNTDITVKLRSSYTTFCNIFFRFQEETTLRLTRHFFPLLLFLLLPISITKAEGYAFLCHPTAEKGEEVLFHSVLTTGKLPDKAMMHIATTGFVLVYVNGRIAMTETVWPYRPEKRQGKASREIDIREFLSIGRNVISVWYAPCITSWSTQNNTSSNAGRETGGQISVAITTVTDGKKEVRCNTEKDWLCTIAAGKLTEKGENFDATAYQKDWKEFIFGFSPAWIGAEKAMPSAADFCDIPNTSLRACKTFETISIFQGNDTTRCYFPMEAEGQIRLTIRGAKKGQKIAVNDMQYRCLGIDDEQFITRFSTYKTDSLIITRQDNKPLPTVAGAEIIMLKPSDIE